jgi:hypothetical protein
LIYCSWIWDKKTSISHLRSRKCPLPLGRGSYNVDKLRFTANFWLLPVISCHHDKIPFYIERAEMPVDATHRPYGCLLALLCRDGLFRLSVELSITELHLPTWNPFTVLLFLLVRHRLHPLFLHLQLCAPFLLAVHPALSLLLLRSLTTFAVSGSKRLMPSSSSLICLVRIRVCFKLSIYLTFAVQDTYTL